MSKITEIYKKYLKPREKEYTISNIEAKKMSVEVKLFEDLSLEQRKLFEEYLFLSKQLEHENNEVLIKFVIDYLNKKNS